MRDSINYFKSGDPNENDNNYWMFSYDFRDAKDHNKYWKKETKLLNKKKKN